MASSSLAPESMTPPDNEKMPDESSKLRMFLGILRKFIGVSDIATVRFSLPSQLLEPTPNLEYWNYLDRPEYFASIGDAEDPLERMLEVVRFWCTKDLKYVKGKPCKPYNSALGEFFRCNWDVAEVPPPIPLVRPTTSSNSAASSIKSMKTHSRNTSTVTIPATKLEKPLRISYLTEQTSHHPPVSAFYVDCPAKGLSARGFDQISAKFTGTSVKVTPGEHNLGIFINIARRDDEQYRLTHPAAHLGGLLRGSLSVTVGDLCYITCPKTKMKTILHYLEEGWLGKAQNRMEGVIFKYDPDNDDKTRIRDVPEKDILAYINGNWRDKIYFSLASRSGVSLRPYEAEDTRGLTAAQEQNLLVDLEPLTIAPKSIPPQSVQLANESLRFWGGVTDAIKSKQFSRATSLKQELEEAQRQKAKAREATGEAWSPRFFTGSVTPLGKPDLSEEGKNALKALQEGRWELAPSPAVASG
ncbi:MAG: hypothetical protein M1818_000623 [Claussenomyces sp. TS43310]|nr:MAG: hypothetical protein M1818_000623 [Claussenomyces sp. TS43310]